VQNPHGDRTLITCRGIKFLQYEHESKVRDIYINRTVACVRGEKLQIQADIRHSKLFKLVIFLPQISSLNQHVNWHAVN
jgi:hypothetical protein